MLHYSSVEIETLVSQIERYNINGQLDKLSPALDELFVVAEAAQDMTALATANLFSGFYASYRGISDEAIKYLSRTADIAQSEDIPNLTMRAHNSLATVYSARADFYTSLTHYLDAYYIATTHPEFEYSHIILNNIGNLFVWLDEFELAASYLEQAYRKFVELKSDDRILGLTMIVNLVEVHSALEDYEKVDYWRSVNQVEALPREQQLLDCMAVMDSAVIAFRRGEPELVQRQTLLFLEMTEDSTEYIYVCRGLLRLFDLSIQFGNADIAQRVMQRIQSLNDLSTRRTFDYPFAALKMRYYNRFLRPPDSPEGPYVSEYIAASEHYLEQHKRTYTQNLLTQIELDKSRYETESARRENALLQRNIELDIFTGVKNKVSTERCVRDHLAQSSDGFQTFVLLDIDLFKAVNDTYGHDFGDKVILQTAQLLSNLEYEHKLVGRFGGDEFVLFLSCLSNLEEVVSLLKAFLQRGNQIPLPDNRIPKVTYSIGVCVADQSSSYEEVFKVADQALYAAKQGGRNRMVICSMSSEIIAMEESDS